MLDGPYILCNVIDEEQAFSILKFKLDQIYICEDI